jgi:hypothetical protein
VRDTTIVVGDERYLPALVVPRQFPLVLLVKVGYRKVKALRSVQFLIKAAVVSHVVINIVIIC